MSEVIKYEGQEFTPYDVDYSEVLFEDYICVNGMVDYVDYASEEKLYFVDQNNKQYIIPVGEIKSLQMLCKVLPRYYC